MLTNQNIVLMAVLECGTGDLSILNDIGYDLGDIVDELMAQGIKPTLNTITAEVFRKGAQEMAGYVKTRIIELEDIAADCGLDDDEKTELEALRSLNPDTDIGWFCNCLDTSVHFENNEEIYRQYLEKEISDVEDNMGFEF